MTPHIGLGKGTSFFAPYLAAAVVIAIYAYWLGGAAGDPTAQQIYSFLQGASSGSWNQFLGYGLIRNKVYDIAYFAGKATSGGGNISPPSGSWG